MTRANPIVRNASRSRSRRRHANETQREQCTQAVCEIRFQLVELNQAIRALTRELQSARRTEPSRTATDFDYERTQFDGRVEEQVGDPLSSLSSE